MWTVHKLYKNKESPATSFQTKFIPPTSKRKIKKSKPLLPPPTAPNEYHIPDVLGTSKEGPIRSAPAYTITGRAKSRLPQCITFPGPGHYDAKIDPLVKKAPMFSMATRFKVPTDEAMKPGPAAHHPEKVSVRFYSGIGRDGAGSWLMSGWTNKWEF